jgi:nicotinamide phosphoribosyltransferase
MIADWLEIFPKGILSIVSDTFDLWKLITEYLPANKEAIMARDGKLVIRSDSGDPVDIICGTNIVKVKSIKEAENRLKDIAYSIGSELTADECGEDTYSDLFKIDNVIYEVSVYPEWNRHDKTYYYIDGFDKSDSEVIEIEPSQKGVIELLWDIFGGTVNEQGYKVLDPHIGAIYGDSITPERQKQIYERLAAKGFAATNIIIGVGSFSYQFVTRDTLGWAAKGSWFEVETDEQEAIDTANGIDPELINIRKSYNIYKDPITDDGTKKSLKGLLKVDYFDQSGEIIVQTECTPEEESQGLLQVIYEDGKFYNQTTFKEIRERLINN